MTAEQEGRTLPDFPTDDFTLDQLEHALNTSVEVSDDGTYQPVGGEFTLSKFLEFMSGHDPERVTLIGYTSGVCGEGDPAGAIPIYEAWDAHYTERCVIRALVAEVRRLRVLVSVPGRTNQPLNDEQSRERRDGALER